MADENENPSPPATSSPGDKIHQERTQHKSSSPGPPPDGGLTAWLHVLGGWLLNFNSWYVDILCHHIIWSQDLLKRQTLRGLLHTFGIFQSSYTKEFLVGTSSSAISWIGSMQGFLMLMVVVLCGRAIDAGYFYANTTVGVFLQLFGMMMVSICKNYWQFMLAQGIVVGIGCGCVFMPSVAIVGTYFSRNRSLALGISSTGGSVGK